MGTYYDPLWIATARIGWRRGSQSKIEAMRAGLDGGINLIDTAEIYESEPLVAEAIKGRRRDELFIATKVWPNHLRHDSLVRALEGSLRRLRLSYVDLYQVHFPNRRVPISETMRAMEEMRELGKIHHIGVSNFSLRQLEEANAALHRAEVVSNQVSYSLSDRKIESALLPYCQRDHIAVLAYYPLGHGKLARGGNKAVVKRICAEQGRTPAQLALNWLISKPTVFAIPRASSTGHVQDDVRASDWRLADPETRELEDAFRRIP